MAVDQLNAVLVWGSYILLPSCLLVMVIALAITSLHVLALVAAVGAALVLWMSAKCRTASKSAHCQVTAHAKSADHYPVGKELVMSFRRQSFQWTEAHISGEVIRTWQERGDAADAKFRLGMGTGEFEKATRDMAEMPEWVDWVLLDEGCRFFVQVWPFIFFGFSWALLGGFGAESASAVLLKSRYWAARGDEGRRDTWLRLRETACWLYDVAAHGAGGFAPGGVAWRACMHVRWLHCRTRATIRAAGSWTEEREKFGDPINQGQLIGTLLGSSALLLQGMEELAGLPLPQRKKDAFIHLWRVIGFLFGIDEDINPNLSFKHATTIMESTFSEGIPESPDAALTAVLTEHICESVAYGIRTEFRVPATASMVAAVPWLFLGQSYGAAIGLPKASMKMLFLACCRLVFMRAILLPYLLIPGAPMVYERIMGYGFTKMVQSIRSRQPQCRFGVVCPMSSGRLGSECPYMAAQGKAGKDL